jgi:hypothetical protein
MVTRGYGMTDRKAAITRVTVNRRQKISSYCETPTSKGGTKQIPVRPFTGKDRKAILSIFRSFEAPDLDGWINAIEKAARSTLAKHVASLEPHSVGRSMLEHGIIPQVDSDSAADHATTCIAAIRTAREARVRQDWDAFGFALLRLGAVAMQSGMKFPNEAAWAAGKKHLAAIGRANEARRETFIKTNGKAKLPELQYPAIAADYDAEWIKEKKRCQAKRPPTKPKKGDVVKRVAKIHAVGVRTVYRALGKK